MIKNYLKTGLRNLLKHKTFSFLNIIGLSLGIASMIVIFMQINYHLSFEAHHEKADRIFRINTTSFHENISQFDPGTPFAMPEALRSEYPELSEVTMLTLFGGLTMYVPERETNRRNQKQIVFTDNRFFNLFNTKWLAGSKTGALDGPNDVVLTRSVADYYFRDRSFDEVVGQIMVLEGESVIVKGVIEDSPEQTVIPWNVLASKEVQGAFNPFYDTSDFNSVMSEAQTFVLVPEGFNVSLWEEQLAGFADKYLTENGDKKLQLTVQSLKEIHFDDRYDTFVDKPVTYASLSIRAAVAILILVLACVNFVNMATAQSISRAKEIGVRKVMGGNKQQLILQFLSETFIVVLFATGIALVFAEIMMVNAGEIIQLPENISILNVPILFPYLLLTVILTTLLGGLYPALMSARYAPTEAIRRSKVKGGSLYLRNGLVVFQFAITQILLIATLVALRQLEYFNDKPLGFDREGIVNVSIVQSDSSQLALLKNLWREHNFVEKVSINSASPTGQLNIESRFGYPATSDSRDYQGQIRIIDKDYLATYGLEIIAGSDLSYKDNRKEVLVNEATARLMGYDNPEEAVGQALNVIGGKNTIAGIIRDFHVKSLHKPVEPTILAYYNVYQYNGGIRFKNSDGAYNQDYLAALEEDWRKVFPQKLFEYEVYQDFLAEGYKEERQASKLLTMMAGIAICIGCLGLYGLIAFMANQKTKEIGVRKVLGATVSQIISLFSKQFVVLIILAFVISAPVAFYAMRQWLDGFYYRIDISYDIFLIAVGSTLAIGLVTILYRAYSAAVANPIDSLRDE